MVDCFSFSLFLGSKKHCFFVGIFFFTLIYSGSSPGLSPDSTIPFGGLTPNIWPLQPGNKPPFFCSCNKHCEKMGVTSLGPHTRPACTQVLRGLFNKTMSRMWIQRLSLCVLYSMGSREFPCPNMDIDTSHRSRGINARFWLVDLKFPALWLVTPVSSLHHYLHYWHEIYLFCTREVAKHERSSLMWYYYLYCLY